MMSSSMKRPTNPGGQEHNNNVGNAVSKTPRPFINDTIHCQGKDDRDELMRCQFSHLPTGQIFPWRVGENEALIDKNFFKGMYPYDFNRVVLRMRDADPLTDYINASYIQGYSPDDKYIACLAPRTNTIDDFWRMIWEKDVPVIAMLTKLSEDGKEKCLKYWPDKGCTVYGLLRVSVVKKDTFSDYCVRTMRVEAGDISKTVTHLHFTSWPDHGLPEIHSILIKFIRSVHDLMVPGHDTVVHCSGGFGRTGTFLALDYLLQQYSSDRKVDVYACVKNLRHQRTRMVENYDQYMFLFDVLESLCDSY